MKLNQLLENNDTGCVFAGPGSADLIEISSIETDNRKCGPGSLFVCIRGYVTDGHRYAAAAAAAGAAAILAQSREALEEYGFAPGEKGPAVILCPDTRWALSGICAAFYGNPSEHLRLIGVTGTKGKTSTTYMIRSVYQSAGFETGLIGTICNKIGAEEIPSERTTPEANVLQKLLSRMIEKKIGTCIMEVSSQGLHLNRVGHCRFITAIFTNLSRDHIGENEHANMEEYAEAKSKLFTMCKNALINRDSSYADQMLQQAERAGADIYTFGIDSACTFRAENILTKQNGVEYDVAVGKQPYHIAVPVPGRFSVYNSLAAFACCCIEGIPPEQAAAGLKNVFVPGKAENVPTGRDFSVLIDYAHNPDSFINILTTVKEYAKRTVFLFGCGGDRNRPRALMGETAGKYADFTIITSDNPRSEDPEQIVRDIEKGIIPTGADYICIVDRRSAIEYALRNARPGDVIILAGKGHETEQILKDRTIPFDERKIVREILDQMQ